MAVAALVAGAALAQDEHARRLAAELVVMSGDLRRLAAASEPPHRLEGLRARLAGALSSLPMLVRQAGGKADYAELQGLRRAFERRDWQALEKGLALLRSRHALEIGGILPAAPTAERLKLGEAIHRQACAGCHDQPQADAQLPAHDLFKLARAVPAEEFAARLLIGVRGDALTAHRNPFADLEIGALVAYYSARR